MTDHPTSNYNYDIFIDHNFEPHMTFDQSPPLGQPAPDFPLTSLDGQTTSLKEIWRKSAYTVVEFGSLT